MKKKYMRIVEENEERRDPLYAFAVAEIKRMSTPEYQQSLRDWMKKIIWTSS